MDLKSPPPCPSTVTVRRNPTRRARPTPWSNPPPASSKLVKPAITPFPTEEILSMEIPQPETVSSTQIEPPVSENLKVYLRIRPLILLKSTKAAADQNGRLRNKNVWPQNPAAKKNRAKDQTDKKKNNEVCVSVNDSQSVTLAPPQALQDSKRIKSVVYEGFSHVFASDISQSEVYEKMVKPLVEEFLNGKSGMLAALGPSGSGKTHTVFGTGREPGMVPLALQHIFKQPQGKQSRSFYISIFEISSEGKAEKIFDLSPDGAGLSMQQSAIKGIQEVPITSAEQAESLIASAMLKRATAMTNTNSQSSRSQCIINIHSLGNKSNRELDVQPNDAVLTVVDLAGAERERRTGNQGSRLLESNFINNTSMVFGLCLRSLLEHQKNPKKPLQKHFQNSLLTRYLRDYLEGKKRMALILTVKPGEEDYLDTSYLLRQASPYMKIKFNNVEEQSNSVIQKRPRIQSFSRAEEPKRKKYCDPNAHAIEEGRSAEELEEGCNSCSVPDAPIITKPDTAATPSIDRTDFRGEREHRIMQNFAKAIWKVLKEYKEELRVAEKEIEILNENLRHEKTRYIQLEKEHEVFQSFCTCSKEISVGANFLKVDNDIDVPLYLDENEYDNIQKKAFECTSTTGGDQDASNEADVNSHSHSHNDKAIQSECTSRGIDDVTNQMNATILSADIEECECGSSPVYAQADENSNSPYHTTIECASTPGDDQDAANEADVNSHSHDHKASQRKSTCRGDKDITNQMDAIVIYPDIQESKYSSSPKCPEVFSSLVHADNRSHNHKASQSKCTPRGDEDVAHEMDAVVLSSDIEESKCGSSPGSAQDFSSLVHFDTNTCSPDCKASGCMSTDRVHRHVTEQMDATMLSSNLKASKSSNCPRQDQDLLCEDNKKPLDLPPLHKEDAASVEQNNLSELHCEIKSDASCKSSTLKKPKRRLLPASSILLRDITVLGIEDESEKLKGNRGGKKMVDDERTQGSRTLVRLLQKNLRL
ncbi:kinesin-like protein KIN-6 isoform X2 [Euphorbia lathyris]|uniref:kinesin-like protein KIN-6 isoform X2 n=1 Tax=Euphorbia lathyris TaxID=212925 RepID=UPI003313163A